MINYPKMVTIKDGAFRNKPLAIIKCHFCLCYEKSTNMAEVTTHSGAKTICPICAVSVQNSRDKKRLKVF